VSELSLNLGENGNNCLVDVPTSRDLGTIPHLAAEASMGGLSEANFAQLLEIHLQRLGFSTASEVWTVPKFPGFKIDPKRLSKIRGLKADPESRLVDLVAHSGDLTILIETKIKTPEHGIGQILLYGAYYRARVLSEGRRLALVLAAPDYVWPPRLAALCEQVGVHAWQIWSGYLAEGGQ